jgi:hypothetical protein
LGTAAASLQLLPTHGCSGCPAASLQLAAQKQQHALHATHPVPMVLVLVVMAARRGNSSRKKATKMHPA